MHQRQISVEIHLLTVHDCSIILNTYPSYVTKIIFRPSLFKSTPWLTSHIEIKDGIVNYNGFYNTFAAKPKLGDLYKITNILNYKYM